MTPILEQLYTTEEFDRGYALGLERGRKEKERIIEIETVKTVPRKEHPRSRWLKYGVVSNGQLLNPTFATETEAGMFLAGLIPANPAARATVKIDAQVIKLS